MTSMTRDEMTRRIDEHVETFGAPEDSYNDDPDSDCRVEDVLLALSWYEDSTPAGLGTMSIDWTDLSRPTVTVTVGDASETLDSLALTTDPDATGRGYLYAIGDALRVLHARLSGN